jgi:hypothetical protein
MSSGYVSLTRETATTEGVSDERVFRAGIAEHLPGDVDDFRRLWQAILLRPAEPAGEDREVR